VTNPARPDAVSWQERQRRLREDAVLDAAAELLAERGFAATSMDEIAARVGVSKPTLYQHFAGKEAVAVAVLRRRFAAAAVDLDGAEAAVAAGRPARCALEEVLHAVLARRAGLWATRVEVPEAIVAADPALAGERADVWARMGRLVDRAKAEGGCRADVPTPVIVRLFGGVFRGDYLDLVAPEGGAAAARSRRSSSRSSSTGSPRARRPCPTTRAPPSRARPAGRRSAARRRSWRSR
jgi:AcrR family transcriptional regulator